MAESKTTDKAVQEYGASSIRSLDQHTHLLKRISLTFGPEEDDGVPFAAQKGVALREILDNALDEARAGHGNNIRVAFYKDKSFEVQDSGRGIPVDVGQDSNGNPASGIYLSLGLIQSGGKFETDSKRFSSGLNGVGASSTVHLSKRADVTVFRNKKKYSLSFKDGVPGFFAVDNDPESEFTELTDYTYVKEEADTRPAAEKKRFPTGTIVKVWLRDSVFTSDKPYDSKDIGDRVKYTAFLVPSLDVEIYDELYTVENPDTGKAEPRHERYHFPDGLKSFMESVEQGEKLHEPIFIKTEASFKQKNTPVLQKDGSVKYQTVDRVAPIELALQWNKSSRESVYSYVNTIHTKLGGSHVKAFKKALENAWTPKITSFKGVFKKDWGEPIIDDFTEGLDVIISVQVSEPNFSSQSKEEYSSTEAQRGITKAVQEALTKWADNRLNDATIRIIAQKIADSQEIRVKAKDREEANRQAKKLSKQKASEKLTDCSYAGDPSLKESTELLICEGNSAASALIASRDPRYNAVLGIRGKTINAYKSDIKKVLANKEVQDLITSIGAGIGDQFSTDNMRYGRVILVTDADPDGKAISCLIYAMMYRIFPGIVENNKLYASIPPLYTIKRPGEEEVNLGYANTQAELDEFLKTVKGKYEVVRNKGLAEMSADQLYDTVIDPQKRVLKLIDSTEIKEAARMLETIMGDDGDVRREWINNTDVDLEAISD